MADDEVENMADDEVENMADDEVSKKIDFASDVLEHNNSLITLIDTKAGLVLGAAGIILGLLSFFDRTTLQPNTLLALYFTMGLLLGTILFSFSVLYPKITSKFKGETAIFCPAITKLTMEKYKEKLQNLTSTDIIDDYANNIYSLAKIEESKFRKLRVSICFMMASAVSLVITLVCYFQPQPIS